MCAITDPDIKKGYLPTERKKQKTEKLEQAMPSTEPKPKSLVIKPRPFIPRPKYIQSDEDKKRKADLKRWRELEVDPKINANLKKTIEQLKKAETLDEAKKIHKSYIRQINTILNKYNRDHDAVFLSERLDINDYDVLARPFLDDKTTWLRRNTKSTDPYMGN
jgi:hypothetical protein